MGAEAVRGVRCAGREVGEACTSFPETCHTVRRRYKDLMEHYFEWSTIVMGEFHMDQMNPHSGLYKSFVDLPSF